MCVVFITLAMTPAEAQHRGESTVYVDVRQLGSRVIFSVRGVKLGTKDSVRSEIASLAVSDGREIIWEVEHKDFLTLWREEGAEEVEYGIVPEGFRQLVPRLGSPRPLSPGKTYNVLVSPPDAPSKLVQFTYSAAAR